MKRFTETTKWKKDWFQNLSVKHKCLWFYLCDDCDAAGVWEPNFRLASYMIGEAITVDDLDQMSGRVMKLECGKYLLVPFVAFQSGEVSADCPAHLPILRSIQKHLTVEEMERVSIGYQKGLVRLQEKEKGKETDLGKSPRKPFEQPAEIYEPPVAEVLAFGSMGAAIPADFCRHYHETKCIKRTWFNGQGVLVDWKREIVKWWSDSRHRWKTPGTPSARRAGPNI